MFYEIPDGVEVPEHAHGAQWGVVLEGTMEFTIGGETRTYRPRRHVLRAGRRSPHSAVISPGYVGIDVFADADRYQAREGVLDQLACVDEQRAARHQQREVARAEEDDARDVVGHRDAAERKRRAELLEREPGRLRAPSRCSSRPGVRVTVGATSSTRIACGPSSTASAFVSPRTPNFDAT